MRDLTAKLNGQRGTDSSPFGRRGPLRSFSRRGRRRSTGPLNLYEKKVKKLKVDAKVKAPRSKAKWALPILLLLVCLVWSSLLPAQTTAELKAKRQQLLQEIQANTQRLTSTRRDKAAALEQLTLLQSQIRKREELVTTLQQEVAQIETGISRTSEVVDALRLDVAQLKVEFSKLLQAAYRAKLQHSWLSFLLSSSSFNEAFRRWQYLRQYQRYRSRQTKLIIATQRTLERKLSQLEDRREEKAGLLLTSRQQQTALANEQRAQDQLLGRLKRSEAGLLTQIKKQEAAREELNSAIEKAIVNEMERIRRADRSRETTTTTDSKADRTAANSSFSTQRGRLPWPVSGGQITRKFGRQPHPTVKSVEISNNGIDIAVSGNTEVKAVATGVVVSTHFVPGYRNMVLVRHGEYYTVYSNLESVRVTNGSSVAAGQVIGAISATAGDLHFEVWRQKQRLNPERWISGR